MSDQTRDIGFGVVVRCGGSPAATTATIVMGHVYNVTPPELSRDGVDVTASDSPNRMKEFIPGLWTAGDLTFDMALDLDNVEQTELTEMIGETNSRLWEIGFPMLGNQGITFKGWLKAVSSATPLEDKLVRSVTITPTTLPTIGVFTP